MIWMFFLMLSIATSLPQPTEGPITAILHKKPNEFSTELDWSGTSTAVPRKEGKKRGLDIALQLKMPTTEKNRDLKTIEKEIETLEKELVVSGKLVDLNHSLAAEAIPPLKALLLKPAFDCDHWDYKARTCWLDRNTGDTVTFSLSTGGKARRRRPDVIWKREFTQKNSRTMKEYVINPRKSSRNLVIGRRGYELRVSPITELDVDDNLFSASFAGGDDIPSAKVNFRIKIVAEDLGFVYVGETIDLAIESYVTIPLESMNFHWYTEKEGESATLPSNMRVSSTGETLRISELRQEQEGIIACSIYTNENVHATKKRFLIKELTKDKDVLRAFTSEHLFDVEDNSERKKKTLKSRGKRLTHRKAPQSSRHKKHRKKAAKGKSKAQREIKEADLEGERYTIVRANQDSSNNNNKEISADGMNGVARDAKGHWQEGSSMYFGNSSDADTVINLNVEKQKNTEDNKVAQIISSCTGDVHCSKHATCVRTSLREKGFCRCVFGFYGPGIFCREQM